MTTTSEQEKLLSDEEMSALLPETRAEDGSPAAGRRDRVVPYNFRRPDRLSKEQVRSLYLMHDLYAQVLSSSLPLFLRAVCEVNLVSVEQQSFSDYVRGMADPAVLFKISAEGLSGTFAVEIGSSVAFPVVDRMLGGDGRGPAEHRAATDLEMRVLEGFLKVVTDTYRDAWVPVVEYKSELAGHETRPQLLQIVGPNEVVVAVVYQMQVGDAQGFMSFCLPIAMLEGVIDKFTQSSYSSDREPSPEATRSLLNTLAAVDFQVAAELDRVAARVSDLTVLAPGDVLRTNHRVEDPVNIVVGDIVRFSGRLAAVDGRMMAVVADGRAKR